MRHVQHPTYMNVHTRPLNNGVNDVNLILYTLNGKCQRCGTNRIENKLIILTSQDVL